MSIADAIITLTSPVQPWPDSRDLSWSTTLDFTSLLESILKAKREAKREDKVCFPGKYAGVQYDVIWAKNYGFLVNAKLKTPPHLFSSEDYESKTALGPKIRIPLVHPASVEYKVQNNARETKVIQLEHNTELQKCLQTAIHVQSGNVEIVYD